PPPFDYDTPPAVDPAQIRVSAPVPPPPPPATAALEAQPAANPAADDVGSPPTSGEVVRPAATATTAAPAHDPDALLPPSSEVEPAQARLNTTPTTMPSPTTPSSPSTSSPLGTGAASVPSLPFPSPVLSSPSTSLQQSSTSPPLTIPNAAPGVATQPSDLSQPS